MLSDELSVSSPISRASAAVYFIVQSVLAVLGKNVEFYGRTVDDQPLTGSRILEDRAEILSMIGQAIKHVKEEDGDFAAYSERLIWVLSNLASPSVVLDRYALLIPLYLPHLNHSHHGQ
jgi:hypothetical protein